MGEVVRFPVTPDGALERLEREIRAERERELRTVAEAFAAADRGDFDHEAIRAVIRGAGTWADYVDLCERIKLVTRVMRACGVHRLRCSCPARCTGWPHCAGGPEGI